MKYGHRKGVKRMLIGLVGIVILIVVYFAIPYSRLKSEFNREVEEAIKLNQEKGELLSEDMLSSLPQAVRKFYQQIGYVNKPIYTHMKLFCKQADFIMDYNKKEPVSIDYTEEVFALPRRLAFIDSKMFGIPFQGLDQYVEGKGSMQGVIAKNIEVFNVTGKQMDEAALATWLCEAILLPKAMLNQEIMYKEIDDHTVEATIKDNGILVSAVFEFDEQGRVIVASTDNRGITESDGSLTPTKWSITFDQYEQSNGYYLPKKVKAIWNKKEGDLIYFDSDKAEVTFQ